MKNHPLIWAVLLGVAQHSSALQSMTDVELSHITGQTLVGATYTAPSQSGNPSNSIGFYQVSLRSEVHVNANMAGLKLGCGGINGTNGCDIDIDRLRITGLTAGADGSYASSDAVLTNPFFEIAIENPETSALREVVGIRFGAENALGMLSLGENPDTNQPNESGEFGINSFSGGFTAIVSDITIPLSVCSGGVNATRTDCGFLSFPLASGVAEINPAPYIRRASGTRMTSVDLPNIPLTASLIGLNINISSDLTENLKNIHQLGLNNTQDFFLSVQKKNLSWHQEGADIWTIANRGWWMELPQIEMSGFEAQRVYVSSGEALGGLIGIDVALDSIDLGQVPVDNCYGGLTFC